VHFAASVDSPETNKKFAESLDATYPILSDPTKATAKAYGVVGRVMPWASRWTFYIGPDGRILYIDKDVNPSTAGADIAARLKALGLKEQR